MLSVIVRARVTYSLESDAADAQVTKIEILDESQSCRGHADEKLENLRPLQLGGGLACSRLPRNDLK